LAGKSGVTRQRRTDGRAAFENIPDVLQAANFTVEIIEKEGTPVANRTFTIIFQDGSQKMLDTNNDGVIRLVKSDGEFSLTSEIGDVDSQENEEELQRYLMK
jgi:hypothetical protein